MNTGLLLMFLGAAMALSSLYRLVRSGNIRLWAPLITGVSFAAMGMLARPELARRGSDGPLMAVLLVTMLALGFVGVAVFKRRNSIFDGYSSSMKGTVKPDIFLDYEQVFEGEYKGYPVFIRKVGRMTLLPYMEIELKHPFPFVMTVSKSSIARYIPGVFKLARVVESSDALFDREFQAESADYVPAAAYLGSEKRRKAIRDIFSMGFSRLMLTWAGLNAKKYLYTDNQDAEFEPANIVAVLEKMLLLLQK